MKQYMLFTVIVMLLLGGCTSPTVYVCADGTEVSSSAECSAQQTEQTATETTAGSVTEETTSSSEESASSQKVVDYTLSDSESTLLESRFAASKRAELSTPLVKNLHVGDVYVAALGIRNILGGATETFTVQIKFREAKDFSGSILQTDDALVQDWLGKNLYTTYTLERGDEVVLPIIIDIGDKLTYSGDPVVPGTYIYDVYVAYITNQEMTDAYQNLVLTIQVVE